MADITAVRVKDFQKEIKLGKELGKVLLLSFDNEYNL
jgi:hypothetical protein